MGSDFNGDGRDDVLWRYLDGDYYLTWHGQANGSFVYNGGLSARQVPAEWVVWVLGDYNGDGRSDILWRHSGGLVTNWLGNADGSFSNNHAQSAAMQSHDWSMVDAGDFNGDRRDDLIWRHNDGTVEVWLATATGGFIDKGSAGAAIPQDWTIMGIGDFNGDKIDDVLWRHSGGLVTNWLGTGDGGFSNNHARSAQMVPNDWWIAGTGDFNGDGLGDVLWHSTGGLLTNWLGTADGSFFNNHSASVTSRKEMFVTDTGDYNGDGRDDLLLWRGDFVTSWLATASGGFVDNGAVTANEIGQFWSVEPDPFLHLWGWW